MFLLLSSEPDPVIKEELCLVIEGILTTIQALSNDNDGDENEDEDTDKKENDSIPDDAKEWPEIPQILEMLVNSDSPTDNSSAYIIMAE